MKRHLLFKSLLLLCALIVGTSSTWADDPTTLFHETFGDNSGSARDWSDTYSSKSGVSAVYSGASYNVTNARQSKNTMGQTKSALVSSQGKTGTFIVGPLNVSSYESLGVTNYFGMSAGTWNSTNSYMKLYYSTNNSTYTEVTRTGSTPTGAVSSNKNLVQASYTLPAAAQSTTLYLKFEFYCYQLNKSNSEIGQAYLDEVELTGTESSSPVPSISLATNSINANAEYTDGTINVTYDNLTNYDTDVIFYESDGTTYASYDHSWLTAEINASTKNLDYSITANTGAARTAYLKIFAVGDEGDVESSLITVTQAAKTYPVVTTLDFTDAGWGFPSDYDESEKSYTNDGYTITLGESSNGHKVVTTTSNTTTTIHSLIFGKKDATLTLPAFGYNVTKLKVYGYSSAGEKVTFNVFVGDDAVSTEVTSSKVDHEFVIAANKQAVGTIYTIKVTNANNCQISKIEVFGNGCEAGLVQSYGWATYIPTVDVEYPANTAYVVTDASVNDGLTLAAVTQVPAGTPLLLKGAGAKTATVIASASDPTTNLLSVCNGTIDDGKYAYVLAKNGTGACFKQWTGLAATLNGRVVLLLDKAAAARGIFELDDDATGIKQVETSKQNAEGFYNLAGQRIANPTKGLYIVNGKKVIIK